MNSSVLAAELLDVTPVVAGSTVSVEISADIAMTYTFYAIPGQARAVVDIAEADPEKVEPLIVVNKGMISSISVDKAQISGIIVSRIIFNLVSESGISVSATPDRKRLTVTFGTPSVSQDNSKTKQDATPDPKPVQSSDTSLKNETAAVPPRPEEDSLEIDEPSPKTVVPPAATALAAGTAVSPVAKIPKLEPVVPVAVVQTSYPAMTIKAITTGESYIDIRTNQPVTDYKATRISGPDRIVIDIAGKKINQKQKTISIKKFGISKARIGVSPHNIRVVIDSRAAGIPAHTITTTDEGLRINFP